MQEWVQGREEALVSRLAGAKPDACASAIRLTTQRIMHRCMFIYMNSYCISTFVETHAQLYIYICICIYTPTAQVLF